MLHPKPKTWIVAILQVETCYSIAQVPKYWNVNTGVFLRRYVYERVGRSLLGLAVTQLVSGLWHGLREGHMIFFAMTIPLFAGSKGVLLPGTLSSMLQDTCASACGAYVSAVAAGFCRSFLGASCKASAS